MVRLEKSAAKFIFRLKNSTPNQRPKFVSAENVFDQKNSWLNFFRPKLFSLETFFWLKIVSDDLFFNQKRFLAKNFFGRNILRPKIVLIEKFFDQKNFRPKTFFGQKCFEPKKKSAEISCRKTFRKKEFLSSSSSSRHLPVVDLLAKLVLRRRSGRGGTRRSVLVFAKLHYEQLRIFVARNRKCPCCAGQRLRTKFAHALLCNPR